MSLDDHLPEMERLTKRLHDEGWADHVSAQGLIRDWEHLAIEVADYPLTIDDFTNDLTGRDAVELLLQRASPALLVELRSRVGTADTAYRRNTIEDGGEALSRYFHVHAARGWWWLRKPAGGRLANYLAGRSD